MRYLNDTFFSNGILRVFAFILLAAGCTSAKNNRQTAGKFIPVFDGRTLNNWSGDSTYWSVEDGCITGTVTQATLLKRNTFIIWKGEMPENFELTVDYKITDGGN